MKSKKKKIFYGSIITLIVLLIIADVGGSFYMINFALLPSQKIKKSYSTAYERVEKNYPYTKHWMDSLKSVKALRDTTIVNAEGLRLHGYFVMAAVPTKKTAVLVHGYTDCGMSMMHIGYLYNHVLHYNILLPENEYHGLSQGDAVTMGWKDRLNILQWAKVANQLFGGNTEIVVHGISMGAATTMMASGETQPSYIKCYVEDCGYTSAWDEFSYEIKEMFHLPDFPLLYSSSLLCKIKYGWSFGEASALNQVKKCHLPMLFIHGDKDTYVPSRMVIPLYEAKPNPKEYWIVRGATHAQSYRNEPQAYTAKVAQFVGKYIR